MTEPPMDADHEPIVTDFDRIEKYAVDLFDLLWTEAAEINPNDEQEPMMAIFGNLVVRFARVLGARAVNAIFKQAMEEYDKKEIKLHL